VRLIDLPDPRALDNVNTNDEARAASAALDGDTRGARGATKAPNQASSNLSDRDPSPVDGSQTLTVKVQYYALFREQAGRSEETLQTSATTPDALYRELQTRYPFQLAQSQLKVAVNADFRDWHSPFASGDTIVFIPPVAGG
jgi:molybdopterin converting factor subunit 1